MKAQRATPAQTGACLQVIRSQRTARPEPVGAGLPAILHCQNLHGSARTEVDTP